jgi:hypothetical protein
MTLGGIGISSTLLPSYILFCSIVGYELNKNFDICIVFEIVLAFLCMKDYAIFVIEELQMNSIIFVGCELLKDIRTKYMANYFITCSCEAKMNTMLKIGNTQVFTHLSLFLQIIVKLL